MAGSGDGVGYAVLLGADGQIMRVPQALRELLELSEDLAKFEWQDLVLEDSQKFLPQIGSEPIRISGYLKKQSGEILEASFHCERIEKLDNAVLVEITLAGSKRTNESEKQVGIDRDSLDFLTTVSHELRVALNGVIGFANVLGGTRLDVEQLAALEKLQACNNMLKGLINDILEYSRVATSKIDLHLETVQLDSLVRDVVGLFNERANKKGLELKFTAGKGTAVRTSLARMRVTQVISNLIGNAIKFTEHGWVSVSVSIADREICIGVQDTGPGVDESELESIFRPFYQSTENARSSEGSGLGLSISRELVEKMGGTLVLQRIEEGGSLFEVTLPLKRVQSKHDVPTSTATKTAESNEPSETDESKLSTVKRILVVEDNQLNADILGHFLQDYGVEFDHVDNGKTAVEMYEDGKYDLVLMDVMLPEMNGYEATEKILSKSKRKQVVPIIGVTAKVFRRDQVRCIEAGMVEVVHKPVDFKQLREVLDFHLYAKNPKRESFTEVPMFVDEDVERLELEERVPNDSPPPTTRGGLDPTTLEAYIDRMKSSNTDRAEVVKTAVGIVDGEIDRLLESLDGGDRKEIGMRAHSLKGALALLGARNILDLAKGLELMATDGNNPLKVEHWGMLMNDSYSEFKNELSTYMANTGSAIG